MPPFAAEYAPCPTLPMRPAPDDVLTMRASTGSPAFDCAAPVLGRVAGRREVALQVHADDRVPLLFARREQHAVADEARVVDEHVEAAERVDRGLHEVTRAVPVGDVVGVRDGLAARGRDLVDDVLRRARCRRRVPSRATPRSFTTTLAPSAANASACSRPIPRPAPVTMTTRPPQSTARYPTCVQFGVTMFMTDQTMGPVELARAVEDARLALAVPPRAHAHPDEPADAAADRRRRARRGVQAHARPVRRARRCAAAVTERLVVGTGICLVAQREPIVTAKAIATLDQLSGGRFVLGIGFGWNADEIEHHGVAMTTRRDVAREHVLAMQRAVARRRRRVRRRVRAALAVVVVAQAGDAERSARAHRRRAPDRSCSRTSPSTPTAGSRSAARASAPRCPTSHARAKRCGRDPTTLRIVPFGTVPDPGKLEYYESIGIDEIVLRVPSAGADRVLPMLDRYAELVGG